ncbi:nitrous oxide reductase accessory protein NosL [Ramlibacter solisilvae]|uniref:NosL n=1 Tax=Ramlibacter tataouinensis TaxID=94132 RepID=A0A127JPH5_9BURK|nr:nitrous oxide reductase accessory protein NosL [Ramlibacter tataouinensis]AMO21825.1 NosL [Ramlibacter tataouinensis]
MTTTALSRRRLLCAACALPLASLVACGRDENSATPKPAEIETATACELDGMMLAEYAGPKAQVHYVGAAAPVFFCDTVEMFAALLRPEQARSVRAAFAQDMAKADWDKPRGHWFDAKTGFYVAGSKRHGSMGPTIASFAAQADAQKFVGQWGGKVLQFAEVTPAMAELGGGALHDGKM